MGLPTTLPSSTRDLDKQFDEPVSDLILRKCKEQPWVPLGTILTIGALTLAAKAVREGNSKLANRMFRWRVYFQGVTVAGLVAGGYYYGETKKQKASRDETLLKLAKDREKLWIEELERIDEESKSRKARAESIHEAFLRRKAEVEAKHNANNQGKPREVSQEAPQEVPQQLSQGGGKDQE